MEAELSHFQLTANKIWRTATKVESKYTEDIEGQLEIHKRILNLHQVGNFYNFIFNIFNGELDYVSETVKDILGYEAKKMTIKVLLDNIHPDDKCSFINFELKSIQFFQNLPFDKIKKYRAQHDFRVKTKNNTYVRILQQVIQIDYDETNYFRSLGVHTDITHIKKEGLPCLSIIGLDGEPSFYNIQDADVFKKSFCLFTKREREILKCIVEGKSSKCIASELHLSLHTIHTHRKNILQKSNTQTPTELVRKAVNEGWV